MLLCQTGRTINVPWPIFTILHFLDYSRLLIYFLQKSIPNVLIYLVFSLRQCLPATEENRKIYKHSCSHQWVLTASCGKSFLKKKWQIWMKVWLPVISIPLAKQPVPWHWHAFFPIHPEMALHLHIGPRTLGIIAQVFFFYINVILSVCITSSFKCYIRFPHITFSHFI